MISALCLAFNYKNSDSYLPGIIIDIYLFYKYCKSLDVRNIIVITDIIIKDFKIASHVQAVFKGYIDVDIVDFFKELNANNVLVSLHYFNFTNQFHSVLENFRKNTNRLILYYSGHGLNNLSTDVDKTSHSYFSFPDKTIIKIRKFQEILFSYEFTDIFFLVDCCHLIDKDFLLPYKYIIVRKETDNEEGTDSRNAAPGFYWKCISTDYHPKMNMMVITSTDMSNVSITSNNGSIFTRWILKLLKESKNLGESKSINAFYSKMFEVYKGHTEELYNSVATNVTISLDFQILCSFPDMNFLPYWLYQYDKGKVCYEIIQKENFLILKNHYI